MSGKSTFPSFVGPERGVRRHRQRSQPAPCKYYGYKSGNNTATITARGGGVSGTSGGAIRQPAGAGLERVDKISTTPEMGLAR